MKTHDFYFDLPPELIAQTPIPQRDASRLLVLDKETGATEHRHFFDLPEYLRPGDCLILNNSRVLPARLLGHRVPGGGVCEILLLIDRGSNVWECLVRPGKKLRTGAKVTFGDGELTAEIAEELPDGNLLVAGDSPDLSTVEDYVVEIDRESGEVVWELNAADLIGKEDGQSASIATDGSDEIDWFHNNSLWYDEKNDLVLLSARHKDAIIAIHKSDKSLAWILGDPANWNGVDKKYFFTPTGDDFEWQYAQHQITMLDNGDIMMFDNGTAKVKLSDNDNRVSGDDIYSRAVVYHINTDDMTIEQVIDRIVELIG